MCHSASSLGVPKGGNVVLSICRLVPVDHGHCDFQQLERYRDIDFPVAGPSRATEQQKETLERALRGISLEDHNSSSGAQIVLVSSRGRIVAIENAEQHDSANGFTWIGCLPAPRSCLRDPPTLQDSPSLDAVPELPVFMCEEQSPWGGRVLPHCFEVVDSLGRSWSVYQLRAELLRQFTLQDMGGVQICRREELSDRLGRV